MCAVVTEAVGRCSEETWVFRREVMSSFTEGAASLPVERVSGGVAMGEWRGRGSKTYFW